MTGLPVVPCDYQALLSNIRLHIRFDIASIFLPMGMSFYTFQTISYTVDIYLPKVGEAGKTAWLTSLQVYNLSLFISMHSNKFSLFENNNNEDRHYYTFYVLMNKISVSD